MRTLLNPNPTSGTSGTATSEPPQLPAIAQSPMLQAALSGLDVSLDEELDRYRHWQANGQRTSYLNAFRPLTPAVTTSVGATMGAKMQPQSTPQLPVTKSGLVKSEAISENVSPVKPIPLPESSNYLENLNLDAQDTESHGHTSALLTALSNVPTTSQDRTEDLNEDDLLRDMADGYYEDEEASEVELNHDSENKTVLSNLLTPLGIASLLLLLLSSAVIGYLLVDPSGLSKLTKPKQASPAKSSSSPTDSGSDLDLQTQQNPLTLSKENLLATPKNTKIPFVPLAGIGARPGQSLDSFTTKSTAPIRSNLELPKVNVSSIRNSNPELSNPIRELPATNLSYESLPTFAAPPVVENAPRVRPRSEALASPIQVNTPPQALAPSSSYNPIPPVTRLPVTRTDTVKFTPPVSSTQPLRPIINNSLTPSAPSVQYAAPISTSTSIPTPSNGYKVIVDNSYVSQAQQVEKEAFVRPSDGNLQLGAYRDANTAQQRAEALRRQGIPARVDR